MAHESASASSTPKAPGAFWTRGNQFLRTVIRDVMTLAIIAILHFSVLLLVLAIWAYYTGPGDWVRFWFGIFFILLFPAGLLLFGRRSDDRGLAIDAAEAGLLAAAAEEGIDELRHEHHHVVAEIAEDLLEWLLAFLLIEVVIDQVFFLLPAEGSLAISLFMVIAILVYWGARILDHAPPFRWSLVWKFEGWLIAGCLVAMLYRYFTPQKLVESKHYVANRATCYAQAASYDGKPERFKCDTTSQSKSATPEAKAIRTRIDDSVYAINVSALRTCPPDLTAKAGQTVYVWVVEPDKTYQWSDIPERWRETGASGVEGYPNCPASYQEKGYGQASNFPAPQDNCGELVLYIGDQVTAVGAEGNAYAHSDGRICFGVNADSARTRSNRGSVHAKVRITG